MKKHIIDENSGISYILAGDYYIPDLALPKANYEIGRFGVAHLNYLKKHRRLAYTEPLTSGRLNAYLHGIDIQTQEMFDCLIKQYAKRQGVTERLKAANQMEWVGRMNNIRDAAEEVVRSEIIFG